MPLLRLLFLIFLAILSAIGYGEYLINMVGMVALGGFAPSVWNDVTVATFMVISAISIFRWDVAEKNKKVIGAVSVFIVVFYATCRALHNEFIISTYICDVVKYADITFALAVALWIRLLIKENKEPLAKQEDSEILTDSLEEEDVLFRKGEANALVERLMKSRNSETAIGISVTGSWGIGKTFFLRLLEKKLLEEEQTVFYFNPWNCNENEVVLSFFDELENHIQGDKLATSIHGYANLLSKGDSSLWRAVDGFVNGNSLSDRYERLKNLMAHNNRQVFVLMDDCDRLDKAELKKAVGLIRNVANLTNLVFIAAFDEVKAKRVLGDDDSDSYLNKMFNLNHPLLPLSNDEILDYIIPRIKKRFKNDDDYTERNKEVNRRFDETHDNIKIGESSEYDYYRGISLNTYLPTFREVKRYLNQTVNDYGQIKEVTENINFCKEDFVLLELIKYKAINLYLTLRDRPMEVLYAERKMGWNSPNFRVKEENKGEYLYPVLERLFSEHQDNPFGLSSLIYYRCYFSKILPKSIITKAEFAHLYEGGVDYEPILEKWIKEGKKNFLSYLYSKEHSMYDADVMEILSHYIYVVCDNCKTGNTFDLMSRGINGNDISYRHSYEVIRQVVKENPIIWEICFQHMGDLGDGENDKKLEEFVRDTEYKLELIALYLQEVSILSDSDGGYSVSRYYFYQLWNDYTSIENYDALQTDNVIQILRDCLLPNVTEKIVIPLIVSNPKLWLGRTIVRLSDGKKKYLLLDDMAIRALFETYDGAKSVLQSIKEANPASVALIDEYVSLLTYYIVHRKVMKASDLKETNFSHLSQLDKQIYAVQPFSAAVRDIPTEFWEGKTYRKYEHDEFYFA